MGKGKHFHGLEIALRSFGGARAVRVVHGQGQNIAAHAHDWPSLTLPVIGGCIEEYEGGEQRIAGPSAVLHPAGAVHADRIDEGGMETVSLQFDPDWLRDKGLAAGLDRSRCWSGGRVAAKARGLAAEWNDALASEAQLQAATAAFIRAALTSDEKPEPGWFGLVEAELDQPEPLSTSALATRLKLHPAWLARAYRTTRGEGLPEALRRRRVERATGMLRTTDLAPVEIALAAGFCDQSHMNRGFRALLGRTPLTVRAERERLARL